MNAKNVGNNSENRIIKGKLARVDGVLLQWISLGEAIGTDSILRDSAIAKAVAQLLENEWPSAGGLQGWLRSLERIVNMPQSTMNGVPRLFLLLQAPETVVGCVYLKHAGEIPESSSIGQAAVVYDVLINPAWRRRGMGQTLMHLVCAEAVSKGYVYLYLSTPAADVSIGKIERFYAKYCGFERAEPIAVLGSVGKSLSASAVMNLEAVLTQRQQAIQIENKRVEGVWMRKQLVERLPQTRRKISPSDILDSPFFLNALIQHTTVEDGNSRWLVCVLARPMPWERQVGPSCGLSCLYNLQTFFNPVSSDSQTVPTLAYIIDFGRDDILSINPLSQIPSPQIPKKSCSSVFSVDYVVSMRGNETANDSAAAVIDSSLLAYVKRLRYSNYGEILDAANLGRVAVDACNLHCDLLQVCDLNVDMENDRFINNDRVGQYALAEVIMMRLCAGESILFAYDRDRNNQPCLKGGESAHWCCAKGFALQLDYPEEGKISGDNRIHLVGSRDFTEENLILLCQHGLSPHVLAAPFLELARSNANIGLTDRDCRRSTLQKNWLVPNNLHTALGNRWLAIRAV